MFRCSDSQGSLFSVSHFLPDDKRERLERDWPGQFRSQALPLINEKQFRDLYCADNGRPNKPVRTVVGVLILKEMFDLTDEEALYRLDYDLGWQVALDLTPEDAHCCQKTLHNFRAKLLGKETAKQLFHCMTDGMLKSLGLSVERQRLDSTHIVSNIARLTRLGLFCETSRLFLRELKKSFPEKYQCVPESLRKRYLKDDGADSGYDDAKSTETQRRLKVCARDTYRLADCFKQDAEVLKLSSFGIVMRLMLEQCEIIKTATVPEKDDADAQEPQVPVILKESKEVSSASLQSPHDIDVTYSGHKGKGYEVQIAETVGNGEKPELITYAEVTPSCKSDEAATVPAVAALKEQSIQPKELTTDTNYASAENVIECEKRGTEIVAPVRGPAAEAPRENEKTLADFKIDCKTENPPVICPAGHVSESAQHSEKGAVTATFASTHCEHCPFRKSCPTQQNANGSRTLNTTLKEAILAKRRAYEQTEEFRKRYAQRSGIEATNSELKRKHGLGKLRVRGGQRVNLSVCFKILACNMKRMVKYFAEKARKALKIITTSPQNARIQILGWDARYSASPFILLAGKTDRQFASAA